MQRGAAQVRHPGQLDGFGIASQLRPPGLDGWASSATMPIAKSKRRLPEQQYGSAHYQALHQRHGVTCSTTDDCDCDRCQNARTERVNGIPKTKLFLQRPGDLAQARRMVEQAVGFYSCERPHLSLKMKTPDAVHRASLAEIVRLEV